MNNPIIAGIVTLAILAVVGLMIFNPQLSPIEITRATAVQAQDPAGTPFEEFGTTAPETFEKLPSLGFQIQALDPDFLETDMAKSELHQIATINNQVILLMVGCRPRECETTKRLVALNTKTNKVFILKALPINPDEYIFLGEPDKVLRSVMTQAFTNP